ncbi:hypothetical protein [Rubellicoccus peritrichatus]|uniref:Cobalamin biosynthesis protein CbiX n=1 Tax=Rubellicoccus peritrichatus TaxID=3080537 RepID=A0AAQ3LD07_9BACT|nr:hypothetical protein [Puniceicoccus sp. CR14]WOO43536.1 hypothetical protein RZN69_10595 [Puniceicoccus sp. CR14]
MSERAGFPVEPVSVLHSSKIASDKLEGKEAEVFETAITRRLKSGMRSFLVIPFFFGPSRALTEFLPERFSVIACDHPDARLVMASPLAGDERIADSRIAKALSDSINEVVVARGLEEYSAVLVDHGTPVREVAAIRDSVGAQLEALLDSRCHSFAVSSMERRPEPEYAFNEPLLENVLGADDFTSGPVVIAHLFLLPGRHAGDSGDIAEICSAAENGSPELRCIRSSLLGGHPLILEILMDRLHETLAQQS